MHLQFGAPNKEILTVIQYHKKNKNSNSVQLILVHFLHHDGFESMRQSNHNRRPRGSYYGLANGHDRYVSEDEFDCRTT